MNLSPWYILLIAGIVEAIWLIALKSSNGFTKLLPSITAIAFAFISFILLAKAIEKIPIGVAYSVWTSIGIIGAVIFGFLFYLEKLNILQLINIGLILIGVIGLKINTN